ncbi:MAG: baseplate assembly protein, partial [Hyphomicrobium sp.]|nr:baseplate assembly protein [Hyphomicrobium sp.]
MATRFTAIDLSQVTPPPVVVPPDAEADIAARKADIVARILPYDASLAADVEEILKLESEPMTKLTEVGAFRELLHYARVNSAALAVMLAFSQGADLEVLGQYYGVTRLVLTPASGSNPAVMESDDSL